MTTHIISQRTSPGLGFPYSWEFAIAMLTLGLLTYFGSILREGKEVILLFHKRENEGIGARGSYKVSGDVTQILYDIQILLQ